MRSMLKQFVGYGVVSCGILFLVSCASRLSNDVVRFHEGNLPQGETIVIKALDPEKRNSLEFEHYAAMIREHLQKIGYKPVTEPDSAELVAAVDYAVSAARTETRREAGAYAYYHFHHGYIYDPFYFGYRNYWPMDTITYTVFDRTLKMNIERVDDGKVMFEGRVRSSGRDNEIAEIMPYMITALFNNYPGESGITKVVTIEKNR